MTIIEAIIKVFEKRDKPLTHKKIYDDIIEDNLYKFKAKDAVTVVQQQLRRHCLGLDFPSSSKTKYFQIIDNLGKDTTYFLKDRISSSNTINSIKDSSNELLPEEKINKYLSEHKQVIKNEILDSILNSEPSFFETLVVDLLLKMGYGWDKTNSGFVNGKSGDGGIDGIIFEDKLGLSKIYIQAKRYSNKSLGRPDLQQFVGAMEHNQKGVYISTSTFTKQAKEYIAKHSKNIVLIDGEKLTSLLVENQIGIEIIDTFSIYKINEEFFQSSEYVK